MSPASAPPAATLSVVAALDLAPGNLTLGADGRLFLSLHQFHDPQHCVCELVDGALVPYPAGPGTELFAFHSVLGIQIDAEGVLWMLDNGDRNHALPKLVGWDTKQDRLHRVFYLPEPVTTPDSFINDLVVDLSLQMIYISDPIQETSAVIRVDMTTGLSTRLLQGHKSVIPENMELFVGDTPVRIRLEDGSMIRPRLGVNGIALDAKNEWVYLSPMHAGSMYRVRSADLADLTLGEAELGDRVEWYSEKPICDGITIDRANNLYVGDLAAGGVGVIRSDKSYELLVIDERLGWTDSFSFGPDGGMYVDCNQLNRSAFLNGGEEASAPPYYILRIEPLAKGVVGR